MNEWITAFGSTGTDLPTSLTIHDASDTLVMSVFSMNSSSLAYRLDQSETWVRPPLTSDIFVQTEGARAEFCSCTPDNPLVEVIRVSNDICWIQRQQTRSSCSQPSDHVGHQQSAFASPHNRPHLFASSTAGISTTSTFRARPCDHTRSGQVGESVCWRLSMPRVLACGLCGLLRAAAWSNWLVCLISTDGSFRWVHPAMDTMIGSTLVRFTCMYVCMAVHVMGHS